MTAETKTATVKDPSVFSLDKYKGGAYTLDATAVSALGALTSASTVADALDLLSANIHRAHVVGTTSIGKATSVRN